MKWLITGAEGQLGKSLVKLLLSIGVDTVSYGSGQMDVTDRENVETLIEHNRPNFIVNAAAWTNVDTAEVNKELAFQVNAGGVKNLALAAQKFDSVLVQISTDYVFSGETATPISEDEDMNPKGVYGASKAEGEEVVRSLLPNQAYILRTAWLYSEFKSNFAKSICRRALTTREEIEVVNDQFGQPTNANDLALQIYNVVTSGAKFGTYHATNSGETSWFGFAQSIVELIGSDVDRVIPISSKQSGRVALRPSYSVLGHRAWKDTDVVAMRHWNDSLRENIDSIVSATMKMSS